MMNTMNIESNSRLGRIADSSTVLTCKQLEDFIVDYFDSNLPLEQQQKFTHHLSLCSACVRYIENYEKTIELTQAAFGDSSDILKTEIPDALVQAILASRLKAK